MSDRISVTLQELVSRLDAVADAVLREKYGVSFSHFRLLATLSEIGRSSITDLAVCLVVTKAAVSKRVPDLVREGWLEVSGDPDNARKVMLDLTAKSRDLVETAGGELDDLVTGLIQQEPRIDAQALHADLRLLTERVLALTASSTPERDAD